MSLPARHRRGGLLTGASASSPVAQSSAGGPRRLVRAVPAGIGAAPAAHSGGSPWDTGAWRSKPRLASDPVQFPDAYTQRRGGDGQEFHPFPPSQVGAG